MTPIVSVVIPTFNSERTLGETLDSVSHQTLTDVETILIDDGSTDQTLAITREFASRYPDHAVCLRQCHAGPYAARNLGARAARGRYIAFLDSDDVWRPDKLGSQVELMDARPEVVLCHTSLDIIDTVGHRTRTRHPSPDYQGHCFKAMLMGNGISTSTVLMRREVFDALGGFDEAFPARGDWELWTRAARRGEVAWIERNLVAYRLHPRRMSLDTDRMRWFHLAIIEKNERLYGDDVEMRRCIREARVRAYLDYATDYLLANRRREARRDIFMALLHHPTTGRGWKLLARAVLPTHLLKPIRDESRSEDRMPTMRQV